LGRKKKSFEDYVIDASETLISHDLYTKSPAVAFLRYCIDAKDAVSNCSRYFKKKKDGDFYKDSKISLNHIISGLLPSLMGHFETFERYLFAGVFENSTLLEDFDERKFFKSLKDKLIIDPERLSAYRGSRVSTGLILADNLSGWHNPEIVNSYFHAFDLDCRLFSCDECTQLSILWQLRHSIVHTGGSVTLPDSQKIAALKPFGGKVIAFQNGFMLQLSRRMHQIVKRSVKKMESQFVKKIRDNLSYVDKETVTSLFSVESKVKQWL